MSGETFWNGLITYDPPIQMSGENQPGNEGVAISGFELNHEGSVDGNAQVAFQISSLT